MSDSRRFHYQAGAAQSMSEFSFGGHANSGVKKQASKDQGLMRGHHLEIFLAALVLILPMLALTVVLLTLIYWHLLSYGDGQYYSSSKQAYVPLDTAYYVDYSATRLVFISSVSSTLAPFMISAGMLLFSYPLGHSISKNSDKGAASKLPTPFQLDLIIGAVEARLKSLWSMLLYVFGPKQRRVPSIPDLKKGMAMLASLGLLAILTSLADVWLHIVTSSVQFEQQVLLEALSGQATMEYLSPSRVLPSTCLNLTVDQQGAGCVTQFTGPKGGGGLINQTEYIRTASNISDDNRIYTADKVAFLGPSRLDPDMDFKASTFGAHSTCEVVTAKCGATYNNPPTDITRDIPYHCNTTVAGMNLTGNWSDLVSQIGTGVSGSTVKHDGIIAVGVPDTQFGFRYFQDEQMQTPSRFLTSPENRFTPKLYWAFHFDLGSGWTNEFDQRTPTETYGVYDSRGLIANLRGGLGGILKCQTTLSDVTYTMTNGSVGIEAAKTMNDSAAAPFIQAMSGQYGSDQIRSGLEGTVARAKTPEDIATGIADAYSQTIASLPAGIFLSTPALNATRRFNRFVTRIPRAPLLAVVITNLLYCCLGVGLTAAALLVLHFSNKNKHGVGGAVRDAQARLGSAAVVAECFESPTLGDDAKDVTQLFAERRGMETRRVGFAKSEGCGRKFRVWTSGVEESLMEKQYT